MENVSRRRFLRQTLSWSALASLPTLPSFAAPSPDPHAAHAPFLGVLGHHPIYSNGPHGDHPVLIRDWDPLFRKYKVDLYMAGHDHDLQHLELEGHPTTHFLSGGGGADLYTLKCDALDRGPYAQQVHGFSHLSVTPKALELRHLDADGRLLYGITRSPSGTSSCSKKVENPKRTLRAKVSDRNRQVQT